LLGELDDLLLPFALAEILELGGEERAGMSHAARFVFARR
jgi:hypothetical protein